MPVVNAFLRLLRPLCRLAIVVLTVLGTPAGATVGWVHFLAFDLFVGRWVYLDSRARGISAWLVSPILFVVLMFGPLGFLIYVAARALVAPNSSEAASHLPSHA